MSTNRLPSAPRWSLQQRRLSGWPRPRPAPVQVWPPSLDLYTPFSNSEAYSTRRPLPDPGPAGVEAARGADVGVADVMAFGLVRVDVVVPRAGDHQAVALPRLPAPVPVRRGARLAGAPLAPAVVGAQQPGAGAHRHHVGVAADHQAARRALLPLPPLAADIIVLD